MNPREELDQLLERQGALTDALYQALSSPNPDPQIVHTAIEEIRYLSGHNVITEMKAGFTEMQAEFTKVNSRIGALEGRLAA